MPTTARANRYRLVWGKQTAEGTPQATGAQLIEVQGYDGAIRAEKQEEEHEVLDVSDVPKGSYIRHAKWNGDPVVNTDHDAIGMPLLLHYGSGSDAVTGATDFTHTFTRKPEAPLWGTFYMLRPNVVGAVDRWEQGVDGFVQALELRAPETGGPLRLALEIIGKGFNHGAVAPVPANTKKVRGSTGFLTFQGATIKWELDATPAVTQRRGASNLVMRSEYANTDYVAGGDELLPRFLHYAKYRFGFTADMIFQDYEPLTATFHGARAPSLPAGQSGVVVEGSIDFTFGLVTPVATKQLQVTVPAMRIEVEPPNPDAGGDPVSYRVTGTMREPAAGEPVTFKLFNQTASY